MINIECTKIVISILQIILSIIALFIAWQGLLTWRKQLRGSHLFKLALRTSNSLSIGYTEFLRSRAIFTDSSEEYWAITEAGIDISTKSKEEIRRIGHTQVTISRRNNIFKVYSDLQPLFLEGKVFWGDDYAKLTDPLMAFIRKNILDFDQYIESQRPNYVGEINHSLDFLNVVYGSDSDEISQEFKNHMELIIKYLKRYLLSEDNK